MVAILSIGCASAGGGGSGAGVCGAGRTGVTECFTSGGTTCQAGQYCDMDRGFNRCEPGCTSDSNCAAGDICSRRAGEAVGVCASCTTMSVADAGVTPANLVQQCRSAIDQLLICRVIDAPMAAAGSIGCETTLDDNARRALAQCVSSTLGDCVRMAQCRGASGPVCGNATCETGETATSCAADCRAPSAAVCGNARCETGETTSCPTDCTDESLEGCRDGCDQYAFFQCFRPGGLDSCRSACPSATRGNREQFVSCAALNAVSCGQSCFDFLR